MIHEYNFTGQMFYQLGHASVRLRRAAALTFINAEINFLPNTLNCTQQDRRINEDKTEGIRVLSESKK